MYDNQFGLCKYRSTSFLLLTAVDDWDGALNLQFLGFPKAFSSVPHERYTIVEVTVACVGVALLIKVVYNY